MNFLFLNLPFPGLVSKKTHKLHIALPPLDLLYMHSMARRQGHNSLLVDQFVDPDRDISSALRECDWVVATTTPYHMWQCPSSDWEWLRSTLKKLPSKKLIVTGLHGSVFPEMTVRETGAHALIRREPEVVFQEFLHNQDWRACSGVSHVENDHYLERPLAKPPEMDEIVASHYDVEIQNYRYFLLGKKTGIFESSRGCPWKCNFCDQEMHNWTYRRKPPTVFASEVENAITSTGMQSAYFHDLEFTITPKHTFALTEELQRRGIHKRLSWACQTRADRVDRESLAALKQSGCCLVHFGVESANPEILKATNKKITLEEIQQGVRLAKEAGLQTACFFMFGLPQEHAHEFDNTLEFARRLNPTYASFHFAIPFPGTPLYEKYIQERNVPWGSWPATYFEEWSTEQIAQYIRKAYRNFYLRPKVWDVWEFRNRLRHLSMKLDYFTSM